MRNTMYWVEIPAANFERAKKFYETIFDITMNLVPIPRGRYAIFPLEMGAMGAGGAIVQGEGYEPCATGAIIYMDREEDLAIPLSKVEAAGGNILMPKSKNGENAEFGYIAHIMDTEGNRIGLHSTI